MCHSTRAPSATTSQTARSREQRCLGRKVETLVLVGVCAYAYTPATPSNCGKLLRAQATKLASKGADGRVNDLGYGNNA